MHQHGVLCKALMSTLPPYYSIKGIHFKNMPRTASGDIKVCILCTKDVENIRIVLLTQSPSSPKREDEGMDKMDEVVVQIATTSDEEYLEADEEEEELEGGETVKCMSNNQ